MTYEDKTSYDSTPPCSELTTECTVEYDSNFGSCEV